MSFGGWLSGAVTLGWPALGLSCEAHNFSWLMGLELAICRYEHDLVFRVRGAAWPGHRARGVVRRGGRRFTKDSARRMRFHLRNCGVQFRVMITLTYPATFPKDWRTCAAHLRRFLLRLQRRYVGIRCFWFIEFQKRGAPHFHIFADRPVSLEWLSDTWAAVCADSVPESERELHRRAGTRCEFLRGGLGAAVSYAAKYARKQLQKEPPGDFQGYGRWWGYRGYRVVVGAIVRVWLGNKRVPVWSYNRILGACAYIEPVGDALVEVLADFVLSGKMRWGELESLAFGGNIYHASWMIPGGAGKFPWFVQEIARVAEKKAVPGMLWRLEENVAVSRVFVGAWWSSGPTWAAA